MKNTEAANTFEQKKNSFPGWFLCLVLNWV